MYEADASLSVICEYSLQVESASKCGSAGRLESHVLHINEDESYGTCETP